MPHLIKDLVKETNKQQLELLVNLLSSHPEIAQGFYKGIKEILNRFWRKVEEELNLAGPPIKSIAEWERSDLNNQLKEAGSKLVVIDFFATWCGPCKLIAPKLDELAKEYEGKIIILKVDVDDCEDIAMEYNVSSMPTFVFIKESKQINSFAGANGEKLADMIAKNV